MSFQSLAYCGFLMLIWGVSFPLTGRPRQWTLLVASYFFYWTVAPQFLALLLISSLTNLALFLWVQERPRAIRLGAGLAVNVLLLTALKYFPGCREWVATGGPASALLIAPIGLSFFTFQAMGALFDAYRGYREKPAVAEYLLYLSFWPVILSGPICRLPEMLSQFRRTSRREASAIVAGVQRILLGLFLKVVVADTLANGLRPGEGILSGFEVQTGWTAVDVLVLCLGYGLLIYCDFGGYTHIAIGTAQLFGIRLRENFDRPFLSVTISDFWNRWHMSLSSWIRDYLFFPLATRHTGVPWRVFVIVLSMALFGAWHGVGLNFVIWGTLNGCLVAGHRLLQRRGTSAGSLLVNDWLSWALTFCCITLGWALFRGHSLRQSLDMYRALFDWSAPTIVTSQLAWLVVVLWLGYFSWAAIRYRLWRGLSRQTQDRLAWLARPVYLGLLLVSVIVWSDQSSPFVYVKF